MTTQMIKRNLGSPDETREFPKGKVEVVAANGVTFGRITLQPGWRWSDSVKPIAKTKSCEAPHTQYVVSGKIHVRMDDGAEMEFSRGDVSVLPPGHDAWVVGNEPFVAIDITGMSHYAETKTQ